jgi:hypothetical protein
MARLDAIRPQNEKLWPLSIFRLWKAAIKDDERLLDEAIAETYERIVRVDSVRAEEVVSMTIRRHRDAKQAFRTFSSEPRRACCPSICRRALGKPRRL